MRWMAPLGALVCLSLVLSGCTRTRTNPGLECRSDADCEGAAEPYCIPDTNTCAECSQNSHCGCREVCRDNACVPLGAQSESQRYNAHGIWEGTPGTDNYEYQRTCVSDEDCRFGEICNAFTGGCIPAADFQIDCEDDDDCPAGPNGEVLVCDPESSKCRPTALCVSDRNCCGRDNTACEPVSGTCMVQDTECTPPEEVASLQPFEPKQTEGCSDGRFCSPLGECVQCMSDADCGDGLRCYPTNNTCVSQDFCTRAAECGAGESCDTRTNTCAPSCSADAECDESEYCNQDNVCRPRTDLPCSPDAVDDVFSETAGNETADEALANDIQLPVPDSMGDSVESDTYSLCSADVDWFVQPLEKGDKITLEATSLDGLEADLTAWSRDRGAPLGDGSLTETGGFPLEYVANFDGDYLVKIEPFADATGTYSLTISKSQGDVCQDPFEDNTGANNTPATATVLNDETLNSDDPEPVPDACSLTTPAADKTLVECNADVGEPGAICLGDVDYYAVRVPAGAFVEASISNFPGDLDLYMYGPFSDDASFTESDDVLLDASPTTSSTETVGTLLRSGSTVLVKVERFSSGDLPYDLEVELETATCTEDGYDQSNQGGGDFDAPGLNDATPSGLAITEPAPAGGTADSQFSNLTLCRGDVDWYKLGLDDGSDELAPIPPNWRLELSANPTSASASTELTMEAGPALDDLPYGSERIDAPSTNIFVERTAGGFYFVKLSGATDLESDAVTYHLTAALTRPPECSADAREDDDVPANAPTLTPGWSSVGDSYAVPADGAPEDTDTLTACADDDDWYKVPLPEGTRAIARLYYDAAAEAELGLAIYTEAVADVSDSAGGLPLATGRIQASELNDTGYQRVVGSSGEHAWVQVYNRNGWPLSGYNLELELVDATCVEDDYEDNDALSVAAPLALTPTASGDFDEALVIEGLTTCDTKDNDEYDFYSIVAGPGDELDIRVFYDPAEDLDLHLHEPGEVDSTLVRDTDDSDGSGMLEVSYAMSGGDPVGAYGIKVLPWDAGSVYALEVRAKRACLDDAYEADGSLPVAGLNNEPMWLCRDSDWLSFDVPTDWANLSVCVDHDYDRADMDLAVYDTPPAADGSPGTDTPVASSLTKRDRESVSVSSLTDDTAHIHVTQDTTFREPANAEYRLWVVDGSCGPPTFPADD